MTEPQLTEVEVLAANRRWSAVKAWLENQAETHEGHVRGLYFDELNETTRGRTEISFEFYEVGKGRSTVYYSLSTLLDASEEKTQARIRAEEEAQAAEVAEREERQREARRSAELKQLEELIAAHPDEAKSLLTEVTTVV